MKETSPVRLAVVLITVALYLSASLSFAQSSRAPSVNRLVVVFDPLLLGESITQFVSRAEASARGASARQAIGDPRAVRMLMPHVSHESYSATLERDSPEFRLANSVILEFETELSMNVAIMTLIRDPRVLRISQGAVGKFSADPLVPVVTGQFNQYQWGLHATNVVTAANLNGVWAKTRGNAYIAIVDNGLKTAGGVHEDLLGSYRSLFSENFGYQTNGPFGTETSPTNLDETPFEGYNFAGHGTHVAGIVAASNSNLLGGAGICPSCSLFAARIGSFTGNQFVPDFQVTDNAIVKTSRRGAQVLNMSFGRGEDSTSAQFPDLHDALLFAGDRDIVVVAASGNAGVGLLDFPANDTGLTIAVGGIQPSGTYWSGQVGFGSNWGTLSTAQHFVAPATQVLSSTYPGVDWAPGNEYFAYDCGDNYPSQNFYPGYGQCQGTSMAAPHVAGIIGLMRSIDPLRDKSSIREVLAATSNVSTCTDKLKCQLGVPDANAAVTAMLGGTNVMNRTTPLFSFFSSTAQNHFYTTVPQMAMSALFAGDLLPQPSNGSLIRYDSIGNTLSAYSNFPAQTCGPGVCSNTPRAIALVYTTHVSPIGGSDLVPLYRLSYRCGDELLTSPPNPSNPACATLPTHISHFYTTDETAVRIYTGRYVSGSQDFTNAGLGYRLDGIEGFVFPTSIPQPVGTVKLCRKYDPVRDDYALFPGAGSGGTDCSASSDGFTGGNYSQSVGGTDWIGWVRLASATFGPTQVNAAPSVSITSPSNNSTFVQGSSTNVNVSASDSDGSIARIRVYVNDVLVDTDTTSPFSIAWNNMQSGVYVVRALAVDNRGAVKASNSRTVTVTGVGPPEFPNQGGFEIPDLAFGTYQANPSGSGFTWNPVAPDGQSGMTENQSAFNTSTCSGSPCYQDAPNGSQMAFIQGEKSISKQLSFQAGSYRVRFKVAQRRQNATALGVRVLIGGSEINAFTPMDANFQTWTSSVFTVATGNYTVTLTGINPGAQDNSVFIDQLKIVTP